MKKGTERSMKKWRSFLLAAAMLLLPVTANGATEADGGQEERVEITDLDGKTYIFDGPIDKVIVEWSGGGGPFFTIASLFGEDFYQHLANLDGTLPDNRMDQYEQYLKDVPQLADLPYFGKMGDDTFDVEAAVTSGADAVLVPLDLKPSIAGSYQPKLEAAGIPVIYIDYHQETPEHHKQSIELIGKLFGREERARELIDYYTEMVTGVYERVEKLLETNERPMVHVEVGMGGPTAVVKAFSNDYSWGKLIYSVGGRTTGEGVVEKQGEIQNEYLLSLDPDKIFLCGAYWPDQEDSLRMGYIGTEEEIRKRAASYFETRAGWSQLSAWKNGEVYLLSHVMARDVFDCVTIEALAKFVWPGEFEDVDPAEDLQDFYERFLPFTYGGIWYLKY